MNRTDLFVATVTQLIDPFVLAEFLDQASRPDRPSSTAVLSRGPHRDVLTPRYELTPGRTGVTGRSETGSITELLWSEVGRLLATVATPERAAEFAAAVHGLDPFGDVGDGLADVEAIRHELAHRAATASGQIVGPEQLNATRFVQLQLRSTSHWTTAYLNGTHVASIHPAARTARVDIPSAVESNGGLRTPGFTGTVTFVPPGDSNAPIARALNRRIGIDRLDPDNHDGARWAVQIDGFDTLIIEASNVGRALVSVYDQDPDQPFRRFSTTLPIPPPAAQAEQRLARFRCTRAGLER